MRKAVGLFFQIALLSFSPLTQSCSSHYLKKTRSTDQRVSEINLEAVRFFRPSFEVADWDDFTLHNRELSCETPQSLWKDFLVGDQAMLLTECLNSISSGVAHYLYQSKTKPVLELDPLEKDQPECLKKNLMSIPLPREVYFLGKNETDTQDVFAMSFDTKANRVLDAELRVPRFQVLLTFPLSRKLKSGDDLELWLLITVLSLFKEEGKIVASNVPELTWKQCFKDDPHFLDKKSGRIPALFWP